MTNRSDRLLFEEEVRFIDESIRQFTLRRSVLARRMRRFDVMPADAVAAALVAVAASVAAAAVPAAVPGLVAGPYHTPPRVRPVQPPQAPHAPQRVAVPTVWFGAEDVDVPHPLELSATRTKWPSKKSKAVKKAELERFIDDNCAICQELPRKQDTCTTNCNHNFCVDCLQKWMEIKKNQAAMVTCPLCLQKVVQTTVYRAWGQPKKKVGAGASAPASADAGAMYEVEL